MFCYTIAGKGKTIAGILIGIVFCVIIWTSPEAAAESFHSEFPAPTLVIDPGHGGEDGAHYPYPERWKVLLIWTLD